MSSCDTALFRLYEENATFRLYADHSSGMSIAELALLCARSEHWVTERIEATRLCLQKQVRIELTPDNVACADSIWEAQVWD
ncbi:MAG TPA: hypothetical protein VH351_04220 [Bryobacteraceae bacterium]|jgi:hypothetical protein|nr:hypothetical protein [Bryobacteraceae bacterium]